MLFNSLEFFLFFPIVVGLYFAIPPRYRWALLLGASYYFYMCWKVEYILLIVFSTGVDYLAGLQMGRKTSRKERLPWLLSSFAANLGLLFFFKYWGFFSTNLEAFFARWNMLQGIPAFDFLLPVGISFYTFQTLSYSIDVYRGELKPEKHLGKFALYVSFFPQLVAGPIERASRLLPQFHQDFSFDYQRVSGGIQQMIWGLFKKVVIADRLAVFVDQIYGAPEEANGLSLLLATYFFAFQIYCDFSGYSDIAIGAARIMGYDLMDNFRTPYGSKSIREFWSRWHISLSTWFRDYLYIPLGGNRVKVYRWYFNLLMVFVVSGFWHGANWTFLVWGALHGGYLILEILIKRIGFLQQAIQKLPQKVQNGGAVLLTFHLTLLAWIFFRANAIGDVSTIFQGILSVPSALSLGLISETVASAGGAIWVVTTLLLACFVVLDPIIDRYIKQLKQHQIIPSAKWVFAGITSIILLFGYFGDVQFIYFQF